MQENIHVPEWAWSYYQAGQKKASNTSHEAEEEKLNHLVQLFCEGKTPASIGELEKSVDNHLAGNRQKARRRNRLLERYSAPGNGHEAEDRLAIRDSLEAARESVTAIQWQLLSGIAGGYSYQELSGYFDVPVGTLKSTVSRVRSGLQEGGDYS